MSPAPSPSLPISARVHPGYLTHMHQARGRGMKGVVTLVAAAGVGYAVVAYRQGQTERSTARAEAAERSEAERRRRDALLMDAYGDRDSIEALEHAMKVYESQQRNK
ncbi:hypothetical protein GQ53DRAFT_329621 [Thozetella sp. PMI_491]|nr:hypothetical protein GQ53DRAFT_329621 [Thozetella sp. PMI_491]